MAEYRSAGWYRDPKGAGERWWNGIDWSDTVRPLGGGPAGQPATGHAIPPVIYSPANPAPQAPGTSLARRIPGGYTIDARANRMAFASVAAGIVGLFVSALLVPSLVAIVFGLIGLAHARRLAAESENAATSRTMSWVGLALGGVGLAIGIGEILLFISTVLPAMPPGLTG